MKTDKRVVSYSLAAVAAIVVLLIGFFVFCTSINIHNPAMWSLTAMAIFIFALVEKVVRAGQDFRWNSVTGVIGGSLGHHAKFSLASAIGFIIPAAIIAVMILGGIFSGTFFNAKAYSEILVVSQSDFNTDLAETVDTDSIALMDTASARKLGDREIGALSDVVSQFDVSNDYVQIDFNGKPIKVSALEYAGFFKWLSNKDSGVVGYVSVDPVSMSASYNKSGGMKYVPSAYFFENAHRYMWMKYPTLILENLHFEIDEEGRPFYVASIIDKSIGLFGGKTVSGCVVLDPVTGETVRYDLADVPRWVDVVFDGDLICDQYNWYGLFSNGYFNSIFAKKDCKQVTTYYTADGDGDYTAGADYGFVSKDGDIWIYTGITSVNGDSSNIGFLLANERTGESRYYPIAGADEKSAMMAAEGEVQEKGYQASFPSLINVDGNPTYIMVLKDSGGLVKLYAAVNVEQYNLVTTAATQSECLANYKILMNNNGKDSSEADAAEVTVTVADVRDIVIDGNTYIYIIDTANNIYKARVSEHEDLLLVKKGDVITLSAVSGIITDWHPVQ